MEGRRNSRRGSSLVELGTDFIPDRELIYMPSRSDGPIFSRRNIYHPSISQCANPENPHSKEEYAPSRSTVLRTSSICKAGTLTCSIMRRLFFGAQPTDGFLLVRSCVRRFGKPRILTRSIGALCSDNGGGANLAGNVRELGRPGPIFRVVVVASAADPALGYWS